MFRLRCLTRGVRAPAQPEQPRQIAKTTCNYGNARPCSGAVRSSLHPLQHHNKNTTDKPLYPLCLPRTHNKPALQRGQLFKEPSCGCCGQLIPARLPTEDHTTRTGLQLAPVVILKILLRRGVRFSDTLMIG